MRPLVSKIFALSLLAAGACGASSPTTATTTPEAAAQPAGLRKGLNIKLATLYVDDQDKALRFYTDVLGFATKDDERNGPFRWLTVTSPGDADGTALLLALDDNPAAKAFQEAMFQQGQPAAMFFTDDLAGDYARIKAQGVEFTMPPTDVTFATIATLNDTCGNLIQLTQLAR
ncbi:MAG TPA: VOC family protein [Kofleriaceae bacterium]|jgi:predicted enzyme related to lactoylglutathione lyase|nr:VOC family protein [Kofleriaceae bacterium]